MRKLIMNEIFVVLMLATFSFAGPAQAAFLLKSKVGPLCAAKVSWAEMIEPNSEAQLEQSKIIACMDQEAPLYTDNLEQQKIIQSLKSVKSKCGYKGNVQVPDKIEFIIEDRLHDSFIEKKLTEHENFKGLNVDIKLQRLLPINLPCASIDLFASEALKIESKNFFRWNLQTTRGLVAISGEFKVLKEVPVLKRNLSLGDRLSSDDWQIEKRDITFINDILVRNEDFEGHSLARGLVAGSPIRMQDLKREFLVEKNQMVKIRMGGQDFEINAMALAESSGYQGDWIKLKNPETQKSFTGVAVAKGIVEVK